MKENTTFWAWFETLKPQLFRRADSFEKTFRYLDTLPGPIIIVETGCMRRDPTQDQSWTGDGCSTMLFDRYVQERGGYSLVNSVDINAEHAAACRALVSDRVYVNMDDSISHLQYLAANFVKNGLFPSLIYLDSFDSMSIEPFETALHCAREFDAIKPALRDETLVVIDDTPAEFIKGVTPTIEVTGKGRFVYTYAQHVGAETLFAGWQVGWTHMVGVRWTSGYDQAQFGRVGKFMDADGDLRALVERARRHVEGGQAAAADAAYRAVMVVTNNPRSGMQRVARGEACAFYARTAAGAGMHGTACDWFKDAIIADPRCVEYRTEMASKGHMPMMNFRLARQEALRATLLEPENPAAWRVLGEAEMALCDATAARAAFERQLALIPDDPSAMLDVCVIALDQGDYARCRQLAASLSALDRSGDATHVLAMIANREGRHETAIDLFQRAIDEGCGNHLIAHWNRSLSLLAIGRYREGWAEHEFRKEDTRNPALSLSFMRFTRPLYEGQPPEIDGRKASILIHAEAGMGDNFACVRFLPELVRRGFEVRYEALPDMAALIQRSYPDIEVVPRAFDFPGAVGIRPFDYHLPVGSMAHVLGIDIDTVPTFDSYIEPDLVLVAKYGEMLKGTSRPRIGLCWSSGIREYGIWIAEYGRRKSMDFGTLMFSSKGLWLVKRIATMVNLQVGPERAQHDGTIVDLLPVKPNWDDTAALIANLDLVITVDTAVAHLAGAMGKPTWLMMQQDGASWHFMAARPGAPWNEASPWYRSIRIFRQERPGDWSGVVEAVARELGQWRPSPSREP